jgi:hypothetical protein
MRMLYLKDCLGYLVLKPVRLPGLLSLLYIFSWAFLCFLCSLLAKQPRVKAANGIAIPHPRAILSARLSLLFAFGGVPVGTVLAFVAEEVSAGVEGDVGLRGEEGCDEALKMTSIDLYPMYHAWKHSSEYPLLLQT